MSIKLMSLVWDSGKLSGSQLLALLAMADFANDDGYCWPSMDKVSKKIRLSERQAIRVMQSLKDQHLVEAIEQGDGRGHTTMYKINANLLGAKKVTSSARKGDASVTLKRIKADMQRAKKGDIHVTLTKIKGDAGDKERVTSSASTLYIDPSVDPSLTNTNTNDDDEGDAPNANSIFSPHLQLAKTLTKYLLEWTGSDTFLEGLNNGQIVAAATWLHLFYIGTVTDGSKEEQEDLTAIRNQYKKFPFDNVKSVVGKIITQARLGNVAPLAEEHRNWFNAEIEKRVETQKEPRP